MSSRPAAAPPARRKRSLRPDATGADVLQRRFGRSAAAGEEEERRSWSAIWRQDDPAHRDGVYFEEGVNMVRHDDPRAQLVALAVEETQRGFNQSSDFGPPQATVAAAPVEVGFELRAAFAVVFDPQQMLPLRAEGGGKAVREAEGDELHQPRFVAVGQEPTFIPAAKTLAGLFWVRWRRPAALGRDQIAHAGIVRRSDPAWRRGWIHGGIWPRQCRLGKVRFAMQDELWSAAVSSGPAAAGEDEPMRGDSVPGWWVGVAAAGPEDTAALRFGPRTPRGVRSWNGEGSVKTTRAGVGNFTFRFRVLLLVVHDSQFLHRHSGKGLKGIIGDGATRPVQPP